MFNDSSVFCLVQYFCYSLLNNVFLLIKIEKRISKMFYIQG